MEDHLASKKFSVSKCAKSFSHAGRGLLIFIKTTHNAWIQIAFACITVVLGFYFDISHTEWMMLVISFGMLLCAEAFNTAIEIDMNLTSPDHHPFARDTKDVAAGAVLIVAFVVIIVCVCIFSPRVINFFM